MTIYTGTVSISGTLNDGQGDPASLSGALQGTLVATLNGAGSGLAYETVSGDIVATPTSGSRGASDTPIDFATPSFQVQLGNFSESQAVVIDGVSVTFSLTGSVSSDEAAVSETLSAPLTVSDQGVDLSGAVSEPIDLSSAALSISGTVSDQTTGDTTSLSPFSGVSVADTGVDQSETVTVTLSNPASGALSNLGEGTYDAVTGVYTVSGTATAVTAALDGLVFTPTPHQGSAGQVVSTGFALGVTDSAGLSTGDDTTTVLTTESAPPFIGSFDGSGLADLVWRNTDGDSGVWLTTPTGGYTVVDFGVFDKSWTIQAAGDFNGDGKADILWRNSVTGQVGEWLSTAGSGLTGFTMPILGTVDASWQIQAVSDFNGDGLSDILWRNTDGDTGLWLTTAAGTVTELDLGVIDSSWSIQGVGDFNRDGKADILWRNTNGDVVEWLSTPGGGYTGFTTPTIANVDPSWKVQGVGDFNGDGLSDILWRNTNGDTGLWLTTAAGGHTVVDFGVVDLDWTIQGVGDYNGDGKADILWRNTATGQVGEWLSNTGAGYAGFTASILATIDPSWQLQDVPPALQGNLVTAPLAQAMAAMGAGAGGASAPMVTASATPSRLIAAARSHV